MTLDPDAEALVRRVMRERRMSFKEAINFAIRTGLAAPPAAGAKLRTPTFHMGHRPHVPLDKALQLAAELEDEELARRLAARK